MICNTLPNILLTKGIFLAFTVMDSALVIVFSLLFFLHGRQFGFGKLLPRIWLALLLRSLLMLIWTTARRTCLLTKLEINFIIQVYLPWALDFFVLTLITFQWMAVYENTSLSKDPFRGWIVLQLSGLNGLFHIVSIVLIIFQFLEPLKFDSEILNIYIYSLIWIFLSSLILFIGTRFTRYLSCSLAKYETVQHLKMAVGILSACFFF